MCPKTQVDCDWCYAERRVSRRSTYVHHGWLETEGDASGSTSSRPTEVFEWLEQPQMYYRHSLKCWKFRGSCDCSDEHWNISAFWRGFFYIRSMVVTTEADSSDTAAHPHDGKPSIYVLCVTNGLHGEEIWRVTVKGTLQTPCICVVSVRNIFHLS